MSLQRFIPSVDHASVVAHLGALARLFGLSLGIPALVALVVGEGAAAARFAGVGAGCVFVGWVLGRASSRPVRPRDAIAVTALAYPVFGLVGAFLYWPERAWLDGFFETVSGLTTTGLSVIDPDSLPASSLFFRSYTQWLGGIGIIVLFVALLSGERASALRLYRSEYHEHPDMGSARHAARKLVYIYLGLSGFALLAYMVAGMSLFDAALTMMSTVSTGGFSPHGASMAHYGVGSTISLVTIGLMAVAAISFPLHHNVLKRRTLRPYADPQLIALCAIITAGGLLLAAVDGDVVKGLFDAASATTTTGFSMDAPAEWSDARKLIVSQLMAMGGPTGSSAGGLKLLRVLLMAKLVGWLLLRYLLPTDAVVVVRYHGRAMKQHDLLAAVAVVAAYFAILGIGTAALSVGGHAAVDALFESASALGTVGLSSGVTSAELPAWQKLLLMFEMWAGRLEVIAVLALCHPRTWLPRSNRDSHPSRSSA